MTNEPQDGEEFEVPRLLGCHFCPWEVRVTAVDRVKDARQAYGVHLQRHGEAAAVEMAERAVFDRMVADLEGGSA